MHQSPCWLGGCGGLFIPEQVKSANWKLVFCFFPLEFYCALLSQGSVEGIKVSCMGFSALKRCSFTPNTTQKKVGFSLALGGTPKSASGNSLTSPGEEFWNAAIELADGISARADKVRVRPEFDAVQDKSSCAVAVSSKTLPRSGKNKLAWETTVGSSDTHQMEKLSNKVDLLVANSQHIDNSPLPVKHLDFFQEDDIQVSGSKCSNEAGNAQTNHVQLKDSGLQIKENLIDPGNEMKTGVLDLQTNFDSSAMIRCQGVFMSTTEGKLHSIREGDKDCHTNKSLAAYSNGCKPKKDSKSKFVSQEVEASTPTNSVPLKDHSKLSSWLPPELCAVYMKKGISELYPWQVRFLFPNYLFDSWPVVFS
jgi:DNA polymerase theta